MSSSLYCSSLQQRKVKVKFANLTNKVGRQKSGLAGDFKGARISSSPPAGEASTKKEDYRKF